VIGSIWPTTYYMHSSVGAYTKGSAASSCSRTCFSSRPASRVLSALSALCCESRKSSHGLALNTLWLGLKEIKSLLSDKC
jgi:hypothetical protein